MKKITKSREVAINSIVDWLLNESEDLILNYELYTESSGVCSLEVAEHFKDVANKLKKELKNE